MHDIPRKTHVRALLLGALFLSSPFLTGFGPALIESDDGRLPLTSSALRAVRMATPPQHGARAALIMDAASGNIVFADNAGERLAPASLTKIMTALVALERADLAGTVAIRQEDLLEGSTMGLRAGDIVTVGQLLWGLLLPSGNDAAHAIARAVGGGSVPLFVDWMNAKARTLGMADTHFSNPHGLDGEAHYSSARDLGILARHAMRDPRFARIVGETQQTVDGSRSFYLRATPQLAALRAGVTGVSGVKTGFTGNAGDCLIASVEREGHRVIVVVLGAAGSAASAGSLVEYAYGHHTWVSPSPLLGRASWSGQGSLMVPAWQAAYLTTRMAVAHPTARPGFGPAGLLSFNMGGREVARMPIYPAAPAVFLKR